VGPGRRNRRNPDEFYFKVASGAMNRDQEYQINDRRIPDKQDELLAFAKKERNPARERRVVKLVKLIIL